MNKTGRVRTALRSVARMLAPLAAAGMVLSTGCHLDMYDQPKYKPLAESDFFPDHASSRVPVAGTVARGTLRTDSLLYTGKIHGNFANVFPVPVTQEVLERGQDRFNIFCSPCHGRLADGEGMIVKRGFPHPPSLLADSVRANPPGFFFDVITTGFGRMYSYAPSVPVKDRWAIVAYLRALQLSQHVPVSMLTAKERAQLQEAPR